MARIVTDMHTHTTCSDGVLKPAELVDKAHACGIQTLAVTDHDTIDGIEPAIEAGHSVGISVIPGVELSVYFLNRELHMLGYYFDHKNPSLQRFLEQYQAFRTSRAEEIVAKLNSLGVPLTFEDVLAVASGAAVGRPHVAQALVNKGYVDTVGQAFLQYLRNRGPADVPKQLPRAEEAIAMLHEAGGLAVLAHPGHWVSDRDVERLKAIGLDGVEIIHPAHDEMLTDFYADVAFRLSLLTTGGSDYHGMKDHDEKNFGHFGLSEEQFQTFQRRRAA